MCQYKKVELYALNDRKKFPITAPLFSAHRKAIEAEHARQQREVRPALRHIEKVGERNAQGGD